MYDMTSKDKPPPSWPVIIRHIVKKVGHLPWIIGVSVLILLYTLYSMHMPRTEIDSPNELIKSGKDAMLDGGGHKVESNFAVVAENVQVDQNEEDSKLKEDKEEMDGKLVEDESETIHHNNEDKQNDIKQNDHLRKDVKIDLEDKKVQMVIADIKLKETLEIEKKPILNVHNHHLDEVDQDYILAQEFNNNPGAMPHFPIFDPNRHIHGALPDEYVYYPSPKIFPIPAILRPDVGNCPSDGAFILIIVITSPDQNTHRDSIRQTWGHLSNFDKDALRSSIPWWTIFVMGTSSDIDTGEMVKQEHTTYGDMLTGDFTDHVSEETRKTMIAFRWVAEKLPSSCRPLFVLKTDCVVFVNTPLLSEWIGYTFSSNIGMYGGKVIREDVPIRDMRNSLYVSQSDYYKNTFPTFIQKPSLIISMDVVTGMAALFNTITPIAMEDAYIGLLAEEMKIAPFNIDKFQVKSRPHNMCHYMEMLFIETAKATVHNQIFMVVNRHVEKCLNHNDL